MQDDWTQAIRREYTGGDAGFDFPRRPLGPSRLMGLVCIGFSGLFIWGPIHMLLPVGGKMTPAAPGGLAIVFNLFPLLFVIGGCIPMAIGLLILFGRCRVEWREGRLRAAELLGPLRWSRRLPRKPIARLEVGAPGGRSRSGVPAPPSAVANVSGLVVVFEDGTKKLLALGYPREWLLGVAGELKDRVGGVASVASTGVQVVDVTHRNPADDDVLQPPAGSRVRVSTGGSRLQLSIPPAGLWRGSLGFIWFPLVWCGFIAVLTLVFLFHGVKQNGREVSALPFLLVFWSIGLGLLAVAVNLGKRSAELVVEGRQLRVTTKGLFGTKERRWDRDEIAAIRADRSNMEVNDRPVIELQIQPRTGKKTGLLAGRNEQELRWLATRLRQALQVPARVV